jgi:hypothetical protein
MFPSHLDGGSHIVSQDDKLRRPAVIKGAEAHDIDFSHNAPSDSQKSREEQEASSYSPESPVHCGVGFSTF